MAFPISPSEISKYQTVFNDLGPIDGKLSGEKVKPVLMQSQLSVEILGKIWDLSDVDTDGNLDKEEFILAMHLVHRCMEGDTLPNTLPPNLIPPGKERVFSQCSILDSIPSTLKSFPGDSFSNLALVPVPSTSQKISSDNILNLALAIPAKDTHTTQSTHTAPSIWPLGSQFQSYVYPEWAISSEEHAKASRVFAAIDLDADGLVSGAEVRDILMRSNLQQHVLAQIWDLVDIQNTGYLNSEQFTVAMRLATDQLTAGMSGRTLPSVLPPALVPPSLRPIPPDPSIFEESNKLLSEIEAINRERASVESAYTLLAAESQRRATEASSKQRAIESLNYTSRSLENQRSEAERRLADYALKRDSLQSVLVELKKSVLAERQKVEEMRIEVNTQQASAKNQEEEISKLRVELNELIREEAMLQDKSNESRRHLESVETANRSAQTRIEKAGSRLNELESTKSQLLEVLEQYKGLLNGESNVKEPDESKVKSLLFDGSIDGSMTSFDTGFGGENVGGWTADRSVFQSHWGPTDPNHRTAGASSVPLHIMSATRLNNQENKAARDQSSSSLGFPLSSDPFSDVDPFKPSTVVKLDDSLGKNFFDDPFTAVTDPDPFKGADPFGSDPFMLPNSTAKAKDFKPDIASAFDPFEPSSSCPPTSQATLTGADFDAVFGPSSTVLNMNDPFGSDPFATASATTAVRKNLKEQSNVFRKSPPPRPKTQPGAGKASRGWKSSDESSTLPMSKSPELDGGFADFGSAFNNNVSSRIQKRGFIIPTQKPSFSLRSKHSSKQKKEAEAAYNRPSLVTTGGSKSLRKSDIAAWAPPGLSEEEQLSWATQESQRLAQVEERARKQEEADLELAIRLSQLDPSNN